MTDEAEKKHKTTREVVEIAIQLSKIPTGTWDELVRSASENEYSAADLATSIEGAKKQPLKKTAHPYAAKPSESSQS